MKDLYLAILFRVIEIDDNLEYLKPIEVIKGFICKDNCFYSRKNKKKYQYEEVLSDEPFVYALPIHIDSLFLKYDLDNLDFIMNDILEEENAMIRIRVKNSLYGCNNIYNIDKTLNRDIEELPLEMKLCSDIEKQFELFKMNDELTLTEPTTESKKIEIINIEQLYKILTKKIIGQDEQIKKIITAIGKNQFFSNPYLKTNIFICGKTGSGKTEIFKQLSKEINIPLAIIDITPYTVSGYVGLSVENIFKQLYENANNDLEKAQKGIIILDEIDKKAKAYNSSEISKEGVLNSLLKLIEGTIIQFKNNKGHLITFDTSLVTFVTTGAFSEIEKILKEKASIGFGSNLEYKKSGKLDYEDLIKYGMPREFIGRFNLLFTMNDLNDSDLYKILTESALSPLLMFTKQLKEKGIILNYDNDLIDYIIKRAKSYNTGARGLKTVVDELAINLMYEVLKGEKKEFNLLPPEKEKIKKIEKVV